MEDFFKEHKEGCFTKKFWKAQLLHPLTFTTTIIDITHWHSATGHAE